MKVKIVPERDVEIPHVPLTLLDSEGCEMRISALSGNELREIGRLWTEKLLECAAEQRAELERARLRKAQIPLAGASFVFDPAEIERWRDLCICGFFRSRHTEDGRGPLEDGIVADPAQRCQRFRLQEREVRP